MRPTQSIVTPVVLLAVMTLAAGCKAPWRDDWKPSDMFSLKSTWPFGEDEDEPQTPERMIGSWTDTVLYKAGQMPQRGFGGRLLFYGKDDGAPVLVEGQLVVYAFDETNRLPTDNRPTRRYVFPAEQLPRHMSKSDLGPSYSFWLPWDEEGGPQTEVSLVARFEPKGGAVVVGEQMRYMLPGKLPSETIATSGKPPRLPDGVPFRPANPQMADATETTPGISSQVQQASYDSAALAAQPKSGMKTTSISLPDNFGRRIGTVTAPVTASDEHTADNRSTLPTSQLPPAPPAAAKFTQNAPPSFQRSPLQAGYKPMPQSPFAGQSMFGTPPQTPPGATASWPPAGAQPLGPQLPVSPAESQWTTTVSYSAPVEAAAGHSPPVRQQVPPPSVGSLPPQPPAPSTPGVR